MNFSYPDHNQINQQQQQISNPSSSLMRYRSAPSSVFADLVNGDNSGFSDFQHLRPSNSKFDDVYGKFVSTDDLQNHTDSSLGFMKSLSVENSMQVKVESSGFLSNSVIGNGFAAVRDNGNFISSNGTSGVEGNGRLENHISFSGTSSNSRLMPQTANIGNHNYGNLQNGNVDMESYIPTFTINSWDDPPAHSGSKRTRDGYSNMLYGNQIGDEANHVSGLTRHMSLPSSSTEMAAIAKYRAKRGFATHPRSIAERVRRSRISQKMRKLQDLFPEMDKQSNTSDMLDLAVDYIKNLQKQVKTLTQTKTNCTCSSTENHG